MTREEKLIMEFAESETMQIKNKDKWADLEEPDFRCSPDKYRPFKSQEECWQEMQKHQPFGWVMRIEIGGYVHITTVQPRAIMFADYIYIYEKAFRYYKFPDGTPFGVKED